MLRFQLEELRGAHLTAGEEEELERQKVFYRNAGKIMSAFDESCALLSDGVEGGSSAVELLREGVNALEPVASLDARYETVYARLDGLCYEVRTRRAICATCARTWTTTARKPNVWKADWICCAA